MKKNYQLLQENILDTLDTNNPKKLLLHACCGPCSSYPLELLSNYFKITILFYNPNIFPKEEFLNRYHELVDLVKRMPLKNKVEVILENYDYQEYLKAVKGLETMGERSIRCYECYKLRMEKSCEYASLNKYDYFTTALSISPYKNADWINEIGEYLANKYNILYLYADFKKKNGYKRSIELSKIYDMYRQDYCGCAFSKKEKFYD